MQLIFFMNENVKKLMDPVTDKLNKQRKEINDLRSKLKTLIDGQQATKDAINSLTQTINTLQKNIKDIEQIRLKVDLCPLVIDDRLIQIEKSVNPQINLSMLPRTCRTIDRLRLSYNILTSSDRFLLTCINSNLCFIDKTLSIVEQTQWDYGSIEDMCWSPSLRRFIVLTRTNVVLVDENTWSMELLEEIKDDNWRSCGCSNSSLYLSRSNWDSTIIEFKLSPSIRFENEWKINDQSNKKQRSDAIVYNHGVLALAINNQSNQTKHIELRLSKSFQLLWSVRLDVNYNNNITRCCRLNYDDWLVVDWFTSRLFHIANDGKIKETHVYKPESYNVNLFDSNILAVMTKSAINFHKL